MLAPLHLNLEGAVAPPPPFPESPPPPAEQATPVPEVLVSTLLYQLATMVQENGSDYGTYDWSSGLWTVDEIIGYINIVSRDFVLRTGIMKVVAPVTSTAFQRVYNDPVIMMQMDRIAFNNKPLYRTDKYLLDRDDRQWRVRSGVPKRYHQDMLPTKTFETDRGPTSAMTGLGYQGTPAPGFGTLRRMSGSLAYVAILPPGGGGGVLRYARGSRAYDATLLHGRPYAGTLRQMVSGVTNFEVIGTRLPDDVVAPHDFLRVPDFCVLYLKFGVLHRILQKEGEGQDLPRAEYAKARYMQGVELFKRLMTASYEIDQTIGAAK